MSIRNRIRFYHEGQAMTACRFEQYSLFRIVTHIDRAYLILGPTYV